MPTYTCVFPQDLNKWFEAVSERIEAIKRTAHSSIRALLFTFTCLPVHNSNPLSTSCTKVTFCPSCFGVCMCACAVFGQVAIELFLLARQVSKLLCGHHAGCCRLS